MTEHDAPAHFSQAGPPASVPGAAPAAAHPPAEPGAVVGAFPRIDVPELGFYKTRLVRGGVWVAARIYRSIAKDQDAGKELDRSAILFGEIYDSETGPRYVDPYELWTRVAGNKISHAEFTYIVRLKEWANKFAVSEPEAAPRQPVDFNKLHIKF